MSLIKKELEAKKKNKRGYLVSDKFQEKKMIFDIKENKKIKEIIFRTGIKHTESKNVLDIVCGTGPNSILLSKKFKTIKGIEPDKNLLNVAKSKKAKLKIKNIEFFLTGNENLPFEDNQFDLITSITVLEHVNDLNKSINEIIRVCKKGGTIYIECPNYFWIYEGHYHLPMFPLMPKWLFRPYATIMGKDPQFVNHLNYVTINKLKKLFDNKIDKMDIYSHKLLKEILFNKDLSNFNKRPLIKKIIKIIQKMGLNKIAYKIMTKLNFYPSIVMVIKK